MAAGTIGTIPKTPFELRGLVVKKTELNPYTSQLSRWSSRLNIRELRDFGCTAFGQTASAATTVTLIFDGFYNWGLIGKAAWNATSSEADDVCKCKNK